MSHFTSQDCGEAFDRPGIPPKWTSSPKEGVGTAYSTSSRVWFTLSHGILRVPGENWAPTTLVTCDCTGRRVRITCQGSLVRPPRVSHTSLACRESSSWGSRRTASRLCSSRSSESRAGVQRFT